MALKDRLPWSLGAQACLAALWLAACEGSVAPGGTPAITDIPPAAPTLQPASDETLKAIAYYRKLQSNYQGQGLYRTDGGGPDTPFTARDLTENFLTIAFFDEFSDRGGRLTAGGAEAKLHRWDGPVRVRLEFGPSVPLEQRRHDRATVLAYLARLSGLTGLSIRLSDTAANFQILVQNPDERRVDAGPILRFAPGTSRAALASAQNLAPDIYCTVFGYSPGRSALYDRSLAIVRAELPDLMRLACYHEELAQGLGLINDSPRARPSIFNDNQEFALLTKQDALMLRILYDPRLSPGMSLAEARPIVETIAAELIPGKS